MRSTRVISQTRNHIEFVDELSQLRWTDISMTSRTYTYISRFISRLPREFMLRFPQTSVLNICFSHVAPLQTPKGKANVRATKRPRQSQRATCAHQTAVLGRLPLPAAPRATRAGSASLHQLPHAMLLQQLCTRCAARARAEKRIVGHLDPRSTPKYSSGPRGRREDRISGAKSADF